jgi:hypothetical protein
LRFPGEPASSRKGNLPGNLLSARSPNPPAVSAHCGGRGAAVRGDASAQRPAAPSSPPIGTRPSPRRALRRLGGSGGWWLVAGGRAARCVWALPDGARRLGHSRPPTQHRPPMHPPTAGPPQQPRAPPARRNGYTMLSDVVGYTNMTQDICHIKVWPPRNLMGGRLGLDGRRMGGQT